MTWIKHYKAALCIANIRGGDEYGEKWHLDGTKERKQNCFDDFQVSFALSRAVGEHVSDRLLPRLE